MGFKIIIEWIRAKQPSQNNAKRKKTRNNETYIKIFPFSS